MLVLTLILTACQKDDISLSLEDTVELRNGEEPQMVPFKSDFLMPPMGSDVVLCFDPETGIEVPIPANREIFGTATHLGKIDHAQSLSVGLDCEFSLAEGIATIQNETIVKNAKGDGLRFQGTIFFNIADLVWGNLTVVEGYGKFSNATGWIAINGIITESGDVVVDVEGMVTQPNH